MGLDREAKRTITGVTAQRYRLANRKGTTARILGTSWQYRHDAGGYAVLLVVKAQLYFPGGNLQHNFYRSIDTGFAASGLVR
jgi:hypothetical protein